MSSIISHQEFLSIVSDKSNRDSKLRGNFLAYVDESFDPKTYPQVLPRIHNPGQPLSEKGYKVAVPGYVPAPGDRVIMVPVGTSDYVIAGTIDRNYEDLEDADNENPAPSAEETEMLYPGAKVLDLNNHQSSASMQIYPNGSGSGTDIEWTDSLIHDPYGFWSSGNSSRITPTISGTYLIIANVSFPTSGSGFRATSIRRNGSAVRSGVSRTADISGNSVRAHHLLSLGFNGVDDYFQIRGQIQSPVGSGTVRFPNGEEASSLQVYYVGPEPVAVNYTPPPEPEPEPDNPTVQRFTKTYYPTWSACWNAQGKRGDSPAYQGRYSSSSGYQYSKWGFDYATIQSDLANASIVKTEWRMKNQHSYYGSGIEVMLGLHNNSTEPAGSSSQSGLVKRFLYHQNNGVALTKTIPNFFAEYLRDGSHRGIMIGSWNSGTLSQYGYFVRSGSDRPFLRITYDKAV